MGLIGDSPAVPPPDPIPESLFLAAFSDVLDVNGELPVTVAGGGLSDPKLIATAEYFGVTLPAQSDLVVDIISDTSAIVRAVIGGSAAGAEVRGKFELVP